MLSIHQKLIIKCASHVSQLSPVTETLSPSTTHRRQRNQRTQDHHQSIPGMKGIQLSRPGPNDPNQRNRIGIRLNEIRKEGRRRRFGGERDGSESGERGEGEDDVGFEA